MYLRVAYFNSMQVGFNPIVLLAIHLIFLVLFI
jgi:hypothetical protein